MDIFISISLAICTLVLAMFGIYASVRTPKTKRGRRNILLVPAVFGIIGVFLVIWQSVRTAEQQRISTAKATAQHEEWVQKQSAIEELVKNLNQKTEESQKNYDYSLKKVNAQLTRLNNSPNAGLKKRALLLSKNILQFVTDSYRNRPVSSIENFAQSQRDSQLYDTQVRSDFVSKFGNSYQQIIAEFNNSGIRVNSIYGYEDISFVRTNYFSMEGSSGYLIELANQIPDAK